MTTKDGPYQPSGLPILYLKLVLTAVFWGGTFIAGRITAAHSGPFSAAFLRFATASLFLFGFMLKSYGKLPTIDRKQLFPVTLLALTGIFAYNALFFSGLKTVPAGRASLIIASNPACIAFFSAIFFRERIGSLKVAGIILSLLGAILVILHGNPATFFRNGPGTGIGTGELYIVGCVASWVSYSLIGKSAMKSLSPLVTVAYACAIGGAFLLPPALLEGMLRNFSVYPAAFWLSIFYLGFFGSALGFIWYYEGIKAIGPSRAGIFINIVPIASVAMAYFILDEKVDASMVAGAILVFSGVYLMNRPQS